MYYKTESAKFMKAQTVYIIPHIQKTGGSTIVNHLKDLDNSEYIFYHLSSRGRVGYHGNKRCFEEDIKNNITSENIILMGHHIDEGLINYFPNCKINLVTILRDPLSRMISHYNMIKSKSNTQLGINQFIKKRGNFICNFLIKRFPSFIEDPLDSLAQQTNSILQKFNQCYFLEDGDEFFTQFMSNFDLKYKSQNIETRRSNEYHNYAEDEKIKPNTINFLNSDYSVYNTQRNLEKTSMERHPNIKNIHYWYKHFYSNFISKIEISEYKNNMLNSLNHGFLKNILTMYSINNEIDINTICSIAIEHEETLRDKESFINFQDLLNFAITKSDAYTIKCIPKSLNSDLTILINAIAKETPASLKSLKDQAILTIKHKHGSLELAAAKIHFEKKQFDKAKESILKTISIDPLLPESYYNLYRIAQKENDKSTATLALEKCLELNPNNKKFKESYIDIFKFN